MLRWLALSVGAVSLLVAGCSGSSGTSCGAVAPCGGDVVGSWAITSSCLSPTGMFATEKQAFFAQFCAGGASDAGGKTDAGNSAVKNDVASASWTGTWSFSATMSYTVSILATVHETFSCDDGEACTALDTEIKAAQANYTTLQSAGCSAGAGGSCTCTVEWSSLNNEAGTYGSSGTALSLAPSGGLPTAQIGYCVQGDTMHWIPTDQRRGGASLPRPGRQTAVTPSAAAPSPAELDDHPEQRAAARPRPARSPARRGRSRDRSASRSPRGSAGGARTCARSSAG